MKKILALTTLSFLLLGSPLCATADEVRADAPTLFARSQELVRSGDFDGASVAAQRAARLAPKNETYRQEALILRRVVSLRKYVATRPPSAKWESIVANLHAFYLGRESLEAALQQDRAAHRKLHNADSESRLAETLLEARFDEEALALLTGATAWTRDDRHAVWRGIALARLRLFDEARKAAVEGGLSKSADPARLKNHARLDALVGDHDVALKHLVHCFEDTPEANMAAMKASVERCPDFEALRATPGYEAALATPSKVKPPGCSGGSDCGSCPKRGGCGKAGAK